MPVILKEVDGLLRHICGKEACAYLMVFKYINKSRDEITDKTK